MKRTWDIFTIVRRVIVLAVIVFVGYFALLANRNPKIVKQKKKITITANPNTDTTIEIVQAENPNPNVNIDEIIKKVDKEAAKEALAKNLNPVGGPHESRTITLIHLHSPKDPDSRSLARSIEEVRLIHPEQLLVTTIDIDAAPEKLAEWRMDSSPSVVFQSDVERLFTFEGVWPRDRLDQKVRELIHGLKRVGKDWRPPVEGMERR